MNRSIRMTAIAGLAAIAACASMSTASQRDASGRVLGCGADEVTIADDHAGWTRRTWTASCRGAVYRCSATQKYARDTQCTPFARAPGP